MTLQSLLATALRNSARGGPAAPYWRDVVLFVLFAEALASAGHEGPPHHASRLPRSDARRPFRRLARGTVTGRRPRG